MAPDPSPDPRLEHRLRAEIERDGPITFARFMAVALTDPKLGYYATAASRPTRSGDFLTAPELHPVFGRLLGRQLAECWERLGRPRPFVLREHGAGAGTLGLTILQGLSLDGSGLAAVIRYEPVDIAPDRTDEIAARFEAAGLGGVVRSANDRPIEGVVLANELLDALPVHRVVMRAGRLREIRVGWADGRFIDVETEPSTTALATRLSAEGVELGEGTRGEICLALDGWMAGVSSELARGYVIVIDYGHPASELYTSARPRGTLLAYAAHRAHEDVYRDVGRQDLTAHVDLTALERAATRDGLVHVAATTQGAFLAGLGIGDLLSEAAHASVDAMPAYLELRAAVVRLLDPRALGGFRVVAFGRDVPMEPPLAGFAFRGPAGAASAIGPPVDRSVPR